MSNTNKTNVFEKLVTMLLFGSAFVLIAFIIIAVLFQDNIKLANPFKSKPAPPLEASGEYPVEETGDPFEKPRPAIDHTPTEAIRAEIEKYTAAIKSDPDKLSHYFKRGRLFLKLNDTSHALMDFNHIYDIEPTYTECRLAIAETFILSNQGHHAKKHIQDVLKTEPDNAKAFYLLGKLTLYQGQFKAASESFNKSQELDPNYDELYISKALLEYYKRNYEAALPEIENALKVNPKSAYALFIKGLVYYRLKKEQQSLRLLNQSIALSPHFYPAFNVRGKLYMNHGQFQNAALDLNYYIAKDHPDPSALFDLGSCYIELKNWEKAMNSFDLIKSASYAYARNNPLVFYSSGFCALMNDQPKKAKKDLTFFLTLAKESKHADQIEEAKKMLQKI